MATTIEKGELVLFKSDAGFVIGKLKSFEAPYATIEGVDVPIVGNKVLKFSDVIQPIIDAGEDDSEEMKVLVQAIKDGVFPILIPNSI